MRVVIWGTYDTGKPRTRIMLRGLREAGVDVVEIHRDVWHGVEDKGYVSGIARRISLAAKWLAAYPALIWRYLRCPRHDAVVVGYLGHLDVLVLWPFAALRRAPVIWDAFLSLYDTMVDDRRLIHRRNPLATLVFALEWLACRAARRVVLDTAAHGRYFAETYGLRADRIGSVFVGVEPERFPPVVSRSGGNATTTVLFYGQFIPLHGIDTIVHAAALARGQPIRWILIGHGQEEPRIRRMIEEANVEIDWLEWVDYRSLRDHIAAADVCLGIFGDSGKAARVIPNKVYQILSSGVPLVTRDSPAIRELLEPEQPGIRLVPAADPAALLDAIRELRGSIQDLPPPPLHRQIARKLAPAEVGARFRDLIGSAVR